MSTWECEEPILKKMSFEKNFTPYPHFTMYDFEVVLVPLNKHPTDDLTYLSRHIPGSVAAHDTLSKEPIYFVDKKPGRSIKRFIEFLTEKQKAIAEDVLKQHPYPSDFQMLLGEVKEQWRQWVSKVPVIVLTVVNMTIIW